MLFLWVITLISFSFRSIFIDQIGSVYHLLMGSNWNRERHPHICNTVPANSVNGCVNKQMSAVCAFMPTRMLSHLFCLMIAPIWS